MFYDEYVTYFEVEHQDIEILESWQFNLIRP